MDDTARNVIPTVLKSPALLFNCGPDIMQRNPNSHLQSKLVRKLPRVHSEVIRLAIGVPAERAVVPVMLFFTWRPFRLPQRLGIRATNYIFPMMMMMMMPNTRMFALRAKGRRSCMCVRFGCLFVSAISDVSPSSFFLAFFPSYLV